MLLEVDVKDYKEFYRDVERKKYCKKIEKKVTVVSLDEIKNEDDNFRDKDMFKDNSVDIENDIETKIELDKLRNALLQLNSEEYKLIKALFFEQKTIREYAKTLDKPFTTIQSRKEKILKKLKKILKY